MEPRLIRQMQRMEDLYYLVYSEKNPEDFFNQRAKRSPSSLEEELVSNLPLFDEFEEQQIALEASNILNGKKVITDKRDFDLITTLNPELGKKIKTIGLKNHQHIIQSDFYNKAKEIFSLSKNYEFSADYELVTTTNFLGIKAACIEKYDYGNSSNYRSLLYHIMRHKTNINGEESKYEIKELTKKVFSGKKVLELGCGPGFFLYTLRELGADVTGLDVNDNFKERIKKANLKVINGNAKELTKLIGDEKFDIIYSKNFLSFAVTREDAEPIMKEVYKSLKSEGLTIHQVGYGRTPEEEYLKFVEESCKNHQTNFERIKSIWLNLKEDEKEILLRKNILNISLKHLQELGFKPLTSYRLDVNDFLTISLSK